MRGLTRKNGLTPVSRNSFEITIIFNLSLPLIMNHDQTISLYQPLLHTIAYKIVRCKADAEDIVQETFLRWLSSEQEKIKNTKAYLIQSVKNNCLNHIQALKRKKEEYLHSIELPEFFTRIKESNFSHLDLDIYLSNAMKILHAKLEPLERAVYILKEVFDFDYDAVQATVNKKKDHCRQLLSRAKKKLNEETSKIHWEMPSAVSLIESFKNACSGNTDDLVNALQKDIAKKS